MNIIEQLTQHFSVDAASPSGLSLKSNGKSVGWIEKRHGYWHVSFMGKPMKAHRVVYAITHGEMPSVIDHIDRVRTNNHPDNLRSVTVAENNRNASMNRNNKTGCTGVHVYGDKYRVYKWRDGKNHYLGTYTTLEDAVERAEGVSSS